MRRLKTLVALLPPLWCACAPRSLPVVPEKNDSPALFADVSSAAGIHFVHDNGATGKLRFAEFSPAGCAFLDYDNDGWLDILLIQSGPSGPLAPGQARPHCALYHNNGNGTFTDVTAGSGLDRDLGYAQGIAVGDVDNDGYDDLFITSFGGNHLLHNEHGTGRFTDITHRWGLDNPHSTGYATSAAFGDFDNDGRLDLYVCYYAPWTPALDRPCLNEKRHADYCSPDLYPPDTHLLFRNTGTRFEDVSRRTGINSARGRGLAVAFTDTENRGSQDIFVANDLTPNMLWHRGKGGTFTDVAKQAGCAYSDEGALMAGMGVAAGDYNHTGRESLFVTNFSGMPNTLFTNLSGGLFRNDSVTSGLALPHLKFLSFGCAFLDYDADGWQDLVVNDGSVYLHAEDRMDGSATRERKQLFHNTGSGTFTEVTGPDLGDLATPVVGRGLAVGDYDNDGRLDVLCSNQNSGAQLFRNQNRSGHHWISFKTVGTRSNRDGYGAAITLTAGGMRQFAVVRSASSYLSASDRRVYFGLGTTKRAERVEIRWPSGIHDTLRNVGADEGYLVTEGRGVTGKLPRGSRAQ